METNWSHADEVRSDKKVKKNNSSIMPKHPYPTESPLKKWWKKRLLKEIPHTLTGNIRREG